MSIAVDPTLASGGGAPASRSSQPGVVFVRSGWGPAAASGRHNRLCAPNGYGPAGRDPLCAPFDCPLVWRPSHKLTVLCTAAFIVTFNLCAPRHGKVRHFSHLAAAGRIDAMSTGHIPFLRQLGPDDADALAQRVRRRKVPRNDPILRAGAAGEEAVLVLSGRVKLVAYGADRREVVLALRGPGELLGDMGALGGQRRTATVIAVDDVEVGFIHADELRRFLHDHPDAALVLIRMLIRRLSEATQDVVDLATRDSVGRIAKRLLDLAAEHGAPSSGAAGGTRIELSLSQDELARWTGATRETVSRALRLMRQLGWVATDHRTITVLDPAALRDRAGDTGN
jgi:CRP/FNR family transcriptional regulator, cyclic AMP receptor protein